MHPSITLFAGILATTLAACSGGNVTSARDYHAPAAPQVKNATYDPYMPYGSANATWAAPIYDRAGTITRPYDRSVEQGRPAYERAPWATGAEGRNAAAPPGTF